MGKNFPRLFLAGAICFCSPLLLCINVFGHALISSFPDKYDQDLIISKQDQNHLLSIEGVSIENDGQTFRFEVEKADFLCTTGSCGHYLEKCRLELDYKIVPPEIFDIALDKEIRCNATVSYRIEGGDVLQCEAGPEILYQSLSDHPAYRSRINFIFYFSYYEAVEDAHLESVNCYSEQLH